jgi:hypothetical protein
MTDKLKEEVTPDQLMNNFKGSSLKSIIIFTVIIHAILLIGGSFPYLYKTIVGEDASEMSEADRTDAAMRKATVALREIAEEHGLKPQDLSSQLAGNSRKAPKAPEPESNSQEPEGNPGEDPEQPQSAIEEEINQKATGPALPKPLEDEDDLFK